MLFFQRSEPESSELKLTTCPRCNCALAVGDAICDVCGAILDVASRSSVPTGCSGAICLRCGTENSLEKKICAGCQKPLGMVCPGCDQHIDRIGSRCPVCHGDIVDLKRRLIEATATRKRVQRRSVLRGRKIGQLLCLVCATASLAFGTYLLTVKNLSQGGGFISLGLLLLLCLFLAFRKDEVS